jgi:hypothetical protein
MAEESKVALLINRSYEVVVSTLLLWAIGSFTCTPKCGSMKDAWRVFNQILHHALYFSDWNIWYRCRAGEAFADFERIHMILWFVTFVYSISTTLETLQQHVCSFDSQA